jgi:hypothetical protein
MGDNNFMSKLTTTFWILSLSSLAFGQTGERQSLPSISRSRFSPLEITAGVGIISLLQEPSDPHRQDASDFGYSFGLAKKYTISDHFQLEGRVLYERKGGKQYDDEQTGDTITSTPVIHKGSITTRHIYDCVTIPLTGRYRFGSKVKFQINAGPYYSFLLKSVTNDKSSVTSYQTSSDITQLLRNDFGYCVGVGVEIPHKTGYGLSIQITNSRGLVNIWEQDNPANPRNWKTNSTLIMVGFPLKFIFNN